MRRKTKITAIIALVAAVGLTVGGFYAKHVVEQKVANQVVATLKSPSAQKEIQSALNSKALSSALASAASSVASAAAPGTNRTQGGGQASSAASQKVGSASTAQASGRPAHTSQNATKAAAGPTDGMQSSSAPKTVGSSGTGSSLQFPTRAAAVSYAMSKFSTGEILHFMSLYMHRSQLSGGEKASIKEQILSHFTPGELVAISAALNK